jgi:beta-mannosidase
VPAHSAGHAPEWKAAVPADPGAGWDFEDVRDHYVRELFGVDPAHVRATEPERYLELGRAAVAHAVVQTFTEWRRPGSGCSGGLVLSARDVDRGAGWGLLDVDGAPKAPLHAVSAAWAPVALLATDEGLDGLRLHLVNDGPTDLAATLAVDLYDVEGRALEHADRDVLVAARGGCSVWVDSVLGAFRDVAYAYRFGARTYDCLRATLSDASGEVLAEHVEPLGPLGARTPRDLRLAGRLVPEDDAWTLVLTTGLLALWVVPQLSGYDVPRRWFHLAPGVEVRLPLTLRDRANTEPPEGTVRALNSLRPTLLSRA